MSPKDYFQQLKVELHGHPLRDRFLEELEDHVEDLEHEEKLQSEEWERRMGEPKKVKEDFIRIISPWGKLKFYGEALFWALPFFPLMSLFLSSIPGFIDEPSFTNLMKIFLYSFFLLILSISIPLRYKKIKSNSLQSLRAWYITIVLPVLLPQVPRLALFNELNIQFFYLPFLLIAWGAGFLILGYKLASLIDEDKKGFAENFNLVKIVTFIYFIIFLIYRTGQTYQPTFSTQTTFWDQFLGPLIHLEKFVTFFSQIMLTGILPHWPNIKLLSQVYLPGIFVCTLAMLSTLKIIKNKKISLLGLVLISYCISIFSLRPNLYEGKADFAVPSLNLSKLIEKQQASIFYSPMKYFNQDESDLFDYKVSSQGSQFLLENNDGLVFSITPSNLNSSFPEASYKDLIEKRDYQKRTFKLEQIKWPNGFECINSKQDPYNEIYQCNQIFYHKKLILDRPVAVADIAMSDDKKWAIFVEERTYDPSNVYLVQLSD